MVANSDSYWIIGLPSLLKAYKVYSLTLLPVEKHFPSEKSEAMSGVQQRGQWEIL
jgi:hypothetical protein